MNDELRVRLDRIYSAIEAVRENDLTKFKPTIISTDKIIGFVQEFSGGQSPAELQNAAFLLIHNVASLYDHLNGWAAKHGKDKSKVAAAFDASLPIRVVYDLWNRDKHGGGGRKSCSGKFPELGEVHGVLEMTGKAPGKWAVYMPSAHGNVIQGGSGCRVITGEIRDKDGVVFHQLSPLLMEAVRDWEKLLVEFGVNLS